MTRGTAPDQAHPGQPEVETVLAEVSAALDRLDGRGVVVLADELTAAPRVFVTGEGRSGFMARAFAMRLMHLGLTVAFVGDTCTPPVGSGDLLVALSGSGSTGSTLRVVTAARDHGSRTVAITSDPTSALAEAVDVVVHVPGATKHRRPDEPTTVQPLSSLFDQCAHLVLDAVTLRLAQQRQVDNASAVKAHANTE
jgi:6-phospho-3-hexuloisomerase